MTATDTPPNALGADNGTPPANPPKSAAKPKKKVSQPTPAKAAPVRQDGLQIDGFGLPVNGVARARVLAELEADDPVKSPKSWEYGDKARQLTEKFYG